MAALDVVPDPDESDVNLVHQLISEAVENIEASAADVVLADEVGDILKRARAKDPAAVVEFAEVAIRAYIAEKLRRHLAIHRSRAHGMSGAHGSVFGSGRDTQPVSELSVFDSRKAVEGNVWKRVGDMTLPDWEFIIEQRSSQAASSLFEVALARRVIKRLPDATTPTIQALSSDEYEKLTRQAQSQAEKTAERIRFG